MKIIHPALAVIVMFCALGLRCIAADDTAVQALLVSASNQKGGSDPKLAAYENTLRRNLPFDTFRLIGEGTATVSAGKRSALSLGRGHRLELQRESGGGSGIRISVEWKNGDKVVMTTSLTLQPGVPAVLGRRGDEGEVPVVLVIAR